MKVELTKDQVAVLSQILNRTQISGAEAGKMIELMNVFSSAIEEPKKKE